MSTSVPVGTENTSAAMKAVTQLANYFSKESDKPGGSQSQKVSQISTDGKVSCGDGKTATKEVVKSKSRAIASLKGLNQIDMILPVNLGLTNSSAYYLTGVVALDPSDSTEWSDLLALYDEYRVDKVTVAFQRQTGSFVTPSPASDAMMVMAYDTTDNTPLSGTRQGCEASKHKLFAGAVSAQGADIPTYEASKPHSFAITMPKKSPLVVSASNTVVSYPGAWKAMGANPAPDPDGFLKVFWNNSLNNTTGAVLAGIIYYHCQFRRRK